VKRALTMLLKDALGQRWYGQATPLNRPLRDEYGRHLQGVDLASIVEAIFPRDPVAKDDRIQIRGLSSTYPNPLKLADRLLDTLLAGRQSYVHGDLHLRNVLVEESNGRGWLIDFAKVKERHILFDFIKLETYIRLMGLAADARTFSLNEYAQFEDSLNAATLGGQGVGPANDYLAKAYQVILTIRELAGNYLSRKDNFKGEYLSPLFLYCLAMMKYHPSNGDGPTQFVFLAACAAGKTLLEAGQPTIQATQGEPPLQPLPPADPMPASDTKQEGQATRNVSTNGGAYIGGSVNTGGGNFVGRDHIDQSIKVGNVNNATGVAIGHGAQATVNENKQIEPQQDKPSKLRLDAAVPRQIFLDKPFVLAVAVRHLPSPKLNEEDLKKTHSHELNVNWPKEMSQIHLQVRIRTEECKIHGGNAVDLFVSSVEDSRVCYFQLTPLKIGPISILLDVYQINECLGTTRIRTKVSDKVIGNFPIPVNVESLVINYILDSNISGAINVSGKQKVQIDSMQVSNRPQDFAQAFALIMKEINALPNNSNKDDASEALQKLKAEAQKGEQADEGRARRWFAFLAEASEDVWEVAVATLANPIIGISTVIQKVAQHAKEERQAKK
jgi:hypothetical protein